MARVREFQCDMCGVHEKTTEELKPKMWSQLRTRGRVGKPGNVDVIVCPDCVAAIDKAASDLVTLVQVTIASRKAASKDSRSFSSLTEGQILFIVHAKALGDVDVLDPAMNEDEDEEYPEDEDEPLRKKRKGKKMRREAGAGDGG